MDLPPKFSERMKNYLGKEFEDFLSSYRLPPSRGLSVNTQKISVEDFVANFPYDISPIDYAENCFYIDCDEKLGRMPLHHGGAFYLQEPSAMLPVCAVDVREDWRALDLCAAPGGKSIMLALKLKNGVLYSNEIDCARAKVLYSNIERMGLKNVMVTNNSSEDYAENYRDFFDFVLVDAPCSGEGMFRKDADAAKMWSETAVKGCARRQSNILSNAAKCLKPGGILVYSTCTFSYEENEGIVSEFLSERVDFSLIKPAEKVMQSTRGGLDEPMLRRFYPFTGRGEGQTLAVLKRRDDEEGVAENKSKPKNDLFSVKNAKKLSGIANFFAGLGVDCKIFSNGEKIFSPAAEYPRKLKVISDGVMLGEMIGDRIKPCHNLFTAYGNRFTRRVELDDDEAMAYLKGEELPCEGVESGFCAVMYKGLSLGGGKVSDGRLKNLYPKGLRNFK